MELPKLRIYTGLIPLNLNFKFEDF